jgi:hypothetical protein
LESQILKTDQVREELRVCIRKNERLTVEIVDVIKEYQAVERKSEEYVK